MKLTRSCFGGTAGKGKSFPARTRPCRGFFGGRRFFAGGPYTRTLPIGGLTPLSGPSQAGFFGFPIVGGFLPRSSPATAKAAGQNGGGVLPYVLALWFSLPLISLNFSLTKLSLFPFAASTGTSCGGFGPALLPGRFRAVSAVVPPPAVPGSFPEPRCERHP